MSDYLCVSGGNATKVRWGWGLSAGARRAESLCSVTTYVVNIRTVCDIGTVVLAIGLKRNV